MLALALAAAAVVAGPVRDYRPLSGLATEAPGGPNLVVLRAFARDGATFHFVVDPRTLATRVTPASGLRVERRSWRQVRRAIAETAYAPGSTSRSRG